MAAPHAYEQPRLNRVWEVVLAHVPTIVVIWLATVLVAAVGVIVSWLILLMGAVVANVTSGTELVLSLTTILGQLGQLPYALLSNLIGVLFVAVPAMHYASGETITVEKAFGELSRRPGRYLLAGLLFSLVASIGFLFCVLPGILVALVAPIYVNRIFLTDQSITAAFAASFRAVYGSPNGRIFAGIEILAWLLVALVALCSCGLGAVLAVPMSSFYLQNAAYHKGLIR